MSSRRHLRAVKKEQTKLWEEKSKTWTGAAKWQRSVLITWLSLMCTTFVAFQMVNKFLQISTDGPPDRHTDIRTDRQTEIITYCRRKRRCHVQSEYARVCVSVWAWASAASRAKDSTALSLSPSFLPPHTLVIMWIRLNCRSVLCVIILFRAIRLE